MSKLLDQKLQEAIDVARESLSQKQILAAFKQSVDLMKQMEKNMTQRMEESSQEHRAVLEETLEGHMEESRASVADLHDKTRKDVDGLFKQVGDGLLEMRAAAGSLPELEEIAAEASKVLTEALDKELPKFGEAIRNALELLNEEDRLDIKAVKGLQEELDKIKELKKDMKALPSMSHTLQGGIVGGGKFVYSYDLSASLDGSTKVFSLPHYWRIVNVSLSSFPNILRPTTDYTTDAVLDTITFTAQIDAGTALAAGQTCVIMYNV